MAKIDQGYILGGFQAKGQVQGMISGAMNSRAEEKQAWMRTEVEKEQRIFNGMAAAGQAGGYEGVIDFLKQNDPQKAMVFEKAKVSLDKDIMENETYKLAHTNDKAKVMIEGYSLLGKLGASIMKASPDDQASMYQAALPIIQQVNPNAPGAYDNGAKAMMELAMGQAMPENLLFQDKKFVANAQSDVGKLQADIDARIAKGETLETSKGLGNLLTAMEVKNKQYEVAQQRIDQYNVKKGMEGVAMAKDQMQAEGAKQQVITSISNRYQKDSKPYQEYLGVATKLGVAFDTLAQDPANGAAMSTLQFGFAKMLSGGGVMSDQDVARTATSTGAMAQAWKKIQSLGTGNVVPLDKTELENIKQIYGVMQQSMQKKQGNINNYYQNTLDGAGLPRNALNFMNSAPPEAVKQLLAEPTEQNMKYFKETFGYVPDLSQDN